MSTEKRQNTSGKLHFDVTTYKIYYIEYNIFHQTQPRIEVLDFKVQGITDGENADPVSARNINDCSGKSER